MKRFISFVATGIIAVLCIVIIGAVTVDIDTVSETAMAGSDLCENHVYANDGEYIIVKPANCSSTGTKYRSCVICSAKDIVTIPKDPDNHSQLSSFWTFDPKPTCVTPGVKFRICSGCNSAAEVTEVPAEPDAHAAKGGYVVVTPETCLTAGVRAYECKHCNGYFGETEIPADSEKHVITENSKWKVIVLPGCAEDGIMVTTCDVCGNEAERRVVPATGKHTLSDEWTIDTEATCVSEGVISRHCTSCDAPFEETATPVNPDKHTFSDEYTIDKAADCISEGKMSKHCIHCDARTLVYPIDIDPDAHAYSDEWVISKEATCSSTGLKHKVCTLCDKKSVSTMIAKTEHSYPDTYEIIRESADGLSAQVKYVCEDCGYEYVTIIVFGESNGNGNIGDDSQVSNKIHKLNPIEKTVIKVDHEKLIISNVARNMLIGEFLAYFTNSSSFVVYDEYNQIVNEEDYIGTGCRLNHETPDGKITNYYVSVTGDIDSDGKINAADARLILRASAKIEELTGVYCTAADVNLDGKVTAADARKTLRVAAHLEYFKETYEN